MTGVVVIDANLLVLLVVGSARREYIAKHKRLRAYTVYDFDLLGLIISEFSEMVLLPHVLAEASNLVRQIDSSARAEIQSCLATLIATAPELPLRSIDAVARDEFIRLGLTDAVILHLCSMTLNGILPTLVTADTDLADAASSMGYSVISYKEFLAAG